ncbi:MAG TPA: S41 family peptidase [Candidatus Pullichristensenella stercoripullorum]|nr:S41 family peptidase [Candidatus Pullichristensenella stercoripullorum]
MPKRSVSLLTFVCVLLIVAMSASTLTLLLTASRPAAPAVGEGRLQRAEEILALVEGLYYREVDEEALETAAIDGMLAALGDPYTFYYTNEAYAAMNEETTGRYVGVGLLVGEDENGALTVLRVFRDSPAEAAGMKAGDELTAIDATPVGAGTALGLTETTALLKGDGEAPVRVEVSRDGEALAFTLTRGDVNINYVEYSILEGEVGYLSIYQFTGDDVSGVEEALSAFRQAGVTALVVDVRSNPGGLLDDVVKICDMLLPEGLIVYTEDRSGAREEYYADGEYWNVPMAVLVNGDSASASEIFAAAVQDTGRGVVVGEVTYGKGVVQTLYSFPEGDGVQLTTAVYYTPSGRSIHGQGVTPDIEVSLAADASVVYHAPDAQTDAQLQAALEALAAGSAG